MARTTPRWPHFSSRRFADGSGRYLLLIAEYRFTVAADPATHARPVVVADQAAEADEATRLIAAGYVRWPA